MIEASGDTERAARTPARCHVTHAWLTRPAFTELSAHAVRRRMHHDALTAAIVDRVIAGGLVDTLLDDPRFA
jgi:hypothetical protein